jgi:hypothetical protein
MIFHQEIYWAQAWTKLKEEEEEEMVIMIIFANFVLDLNETIQIGSKDICTKMVYSFLYQFGTYLPWYLPTYDYDSYE